MAELTVSRKSIYDLLKIEGRKYVIPEYQRPYKWEKEECETLWLDVTAFFQENPGNDSEYFLGTIVTCKTDDDSPSKNIEVIDGQQRITSLLLLLRAFHKKLELMVEDDNIRGLKTSIAPCIWDLDPITLKVTDPARVHIESRVATEADNATLHNILRCGDTDPKKRDLYSQNYRFFLEQCENYARDNAPYWQPFCVALLKRCIILPIECDRRDAALAIFSTLNNRGMPLSDSDIFKAQIYKSKPSQQEKIQFTEAWKELSETVENAKMSLDDLFRHYTHRIRAKAGDKSKEIGLRAFYEGANKKFERLKAPELMDELSGLAAFWVAIAKRATEFNGNTISNEAFTRIHCLEQYPNEWWKYVTSVFYFTHRESRDFTAEFSSFLDTLVAFLVSQFAMTPTVNSIKDPVIQFCIDLEKGNGLAVTGSLSSDFRAKLAEAANGRLERALVLLHAYLNPTQKELLPANFDIEHIFPRKWQNTSYNGWTQEDAAASLERLGNKVAIERKVNIQAGNGYFGRKKKKYAEGSKVAEVLALSKLPQDDWSRDDIENREKSVLDALVGFLSSHFPPSTSSSSAL